jgi:hypothetical protein
MDYPGKVITKNQVTPTQISATGVWTLDDAAAATRNNNWPVALVPNPISKSLRFNSADTAYLNRTPSVAGNRKTWTWSAWVKLSKDDSTLISARTNDSNRSNLTISSGAINLAVQIAGVATNTTSSDLLRDYSAWYHIVVAFDTTQATAANRVKFYKNGVEITSYSSAQYPAQNADGEINNNSAHSIGRIEFSTPVAYLNGYMTEINFIDGQQLTPSSFGMTNPQTGQWIPLKYSGTYGTNGFYLNFKDATSTTTLGLDYSGNANNWTTNNFSVTAGAGNDSLTDVPTPWVAYNTTGDVGGVVRGNYCTLNPLQNRAADTFSDGNLRVVTSSSNYGTFTSTIAIPTTGKWYCEATIVATPSYPAVGIVAIDSNFTTTSWIGSLNGVTYYGNNGNKYVNTTGSSYGATYTTNDVIGIAYDADNATITFYKNNTSQGSITGVTARTYYFGGSEFDVASGTQVWNFGQRPFAYTPPSGFLSLCTTNLPASTILAGNQYFDATLYTGTGSSQTITNSGSMQPDFFWSKGRSAANAHVLIDSVRGATTFLSSNNTDADVTTTNGTLSSFNSNGVTLQADTNGYANFSGRTYVGWQWKAGGTAVTNTAGTITSTVSANTTSGFSIVTYTGTGANATVGHGLGVAPSMYIVKSRTDGTAQWVVYHASLGNTKSLYLNATNSAGTSSLWWNNTSPTSSVFSLSTSSDVNVNTQNYVAYCFAAIFGFSAFGSYTGNGSADGPFVYLGFRPRYLLVKRSDSTGDWIILDTSRDTYNLCTKLLYSNLSNAEETYNVTDILSNGFKQRNVFGALNASGGTYTYMAFAENPFKNALAR